MNSGSAKMRRQFAALVFTQKKVSSIGVWSFNGAMIQVRIKMYRWVSSV